MAETHIGDPNDPILLPFANINTECETSDCRIAAGNQTTNRILVHYPNPETFANTVNASVVYDSNSVRTYTANPVTMAMRGVDSSGSCINETVESFGERIDSETQNLVTCGTNVNLVARYSGAISCSVTLTIQYIKKAETTSCFNIETITDTFSDSIEFGRSSAYSQRMGTTQPFLSRKPHRCGTVAGRQCFTQQAATFPPDCPYCCIYTARCALLCGPEDDFNCTPIDNNQTQLGSYVRGRASIQDWIALNSVANQAASNIRTLIGNDYATAAKAMRQKVKAFVRNLKNQIPEDTCLIIKKEYTGVDLTITQS